jgi:hypothetical protein
VAATALPTKAKRYKAARSRANQANSALTSWPSYNPWTGIINMYLNPTPRGWGRGDTTAIPPSAAVDSRHCAWTDHGRPSLHATVGTDPGSTTNVHRPATADHVSVLNTLARLMGPTVAGQLLQHDDAPNAILTYRVGCQLWCVEPHDT